MQQRDERRSPGVRRGPLNQHLRKLGWLPLSPTHRSPGPCASSVVPLQVRRTSPQDWDQAIPKVLAEIGRRRIPKRRHRTSPRALNASATTATASRNAARPAAPVIPAQPPSESTPSNHEQPDRELRYVALGPGSNALTAFRTLGPPSHNDVAFRVTPSGSFAAVDSSRAIRMSSASPLRSIGTTAMIATRSRQFDPEAITATASKLSSDSRIE